ncbi:unnamed protein product [Phaeothamnion confervicola]
MAKPLHQRRQQRFLHGRSVARFALLSRLAVVSLAVFADLLLPDHDAEGVLRFTRYEFNGAVNGRWGSPLAAFIKWDSAWFLTIATNGYPEPHDSVAQESWRENDSAEDAETTAFQEQAHAFFPLYPFLAQALAAVIRFATGTLTWTAATVVAAVLLSNACFIAASVLFYRLGVVVLHEERAAYRGALAFCFSPAGIFFSSVYSESLFAALTFAGFLALTSARAQAGEAFLKARGGSGGGGGGWRGAWAAAILLSTATACRSNGLVSGAAFGLEKLRWMASDHVAINNESTSSVTMARHLQEATPESAEGKLLRMKSATIYLRLAAAALATALQLVLIVAPYFLYQLYCFRKFCMPLQCPDGNISVGGGGAKVFEPFCRARPSWCDSALPSLYAHVQSTYWEVGLFRYYSWCHLPNFLLAAPAIALSVAGVGAYLQVYWWQLAPAGRAEAAAAAVAVASSGIPGPGPLSAIDRKGETQGAALSGAPRGGRGGSGGAGRLGECDSRASKFAAVLRQFGGSTLPSAKAPAFYRGSVAPFIAQWALLTTSAVLFVNIQVTTRLLAAACPALHWYAALLLFPPPSSKGRALSELSGVEPSTASELRMPAAAVSDSGNTLSAHRRRRQRRQELLSRAMWVYVIAYNVVGTVMHANFLPWT